MHDWLLSSGILNGDTRELGFMDRNCKWKAVTVGYNWLPTSGFLYCLERMIRDISAK